MHTHQQNLLQVGPLPLRCQAKQYQLVQNVTLDNFNYHVSLNSPRPRIVSTPILSLELNEINSALEKFQHRMHAHIVGWV